MGGFIMASIINASTSGAGGVITTADASGELQLQSGGTTVVSIPNTTTLNFPNANQKIIANQDLYFQTNQNDSSININLNPSGTHRYSAFRIYNTSDTANSGIFQINGNIAGTVFRISSYTSGTGTVVPIDVQVGSTIQSRFQTNGDFQFNSGYGSAAVAYGCRAWVNFDGTGTVAIRASGNVSSITDDGTGDYSVNFTNAMPDANYALTSSSVRVTNPYIIGWTSSTTSLVKVRAVNTTTNTLTDVMDVMIAIFR
jgi:hypothetical protein